MEFDEALAILKSLSDENRLRVVLALKGEEEICACKLLEKLNCRQSTLSHHMKLLVGCGLVRVKQEWKWTHYSLDHERLNSLSDFLMGGEEL